MADIRLTYEVAHANAQVARRMYQTRYFQLVVEDVQSFVSTPVRLHETDIHKRTTNIPGKHVGVRPVDK